MKTTELVRLNDKWRIVDDPLQWILERRRGVPGKKSTGWVGNAYCMTRRALLRNIRERAGEVDPAAVAYIEPWPERHELGAVEPMAETAPTPSRTRVPSATLIIEF